MAILVITYSDDNISVADVIDRLRAAGEEVYRLDTDRLPPDVAIASRSTTAGLSTSFRCGDDRFDLDRVGAVWYRRNRVGLGLPKEMERELREVAIQEARTALFGAVDALPVFQMDRFWTVRRASQKPRQLALARELGLPTPPTLITNDADEVRSFAADHGPLVFKPVSDIAVGDDYPVKRVWTNRLTDEELASLDGLEYSPMIFQREIPKAREIRATVVGRKVFCASVDPSIAGADDDWRRQGDALVDKWDLSDLPADLQAKLLAMMDRLELNYGAADFLQTPDGDYYFLEVNPAGEFCWLDRLTPLPLAEAITELLLERGHAPVS